MVLLTFKVTRRPLDPRGAQTTGTTLAYLLGPATQSLLLLYLPRSHVTAEVIPDWRCNKLVLLSSLIGALSW